MLRSLFGKWKQPIYYGFDDNHMESKLEKIVVRMENVGFPVVAIVHDLGSTNLRVWNNFKIDPVNSKASFKNPCADRDVFVFADAPHMIKLI